MIIDNAVLQRVDRRSVDATGEASFATGAGVEIVCYVEPYDGQRFNLGVEIKDLQCVCTVYKSDIAAAGEADPRQGDLLTIQVEGESPQSFSVALRKDRVLDELSHWELFLKNAVAGGGA